MQVSRNKQTYTLGSQTLLTLIKDCVHESPLLDLVVLSPPGSFRNILSFWLSEARCLFMVGFCLGMSNMASTASTKRSAPNTPQIKNYIYHITKLLHVVSTIIQSYLSVLHDPIMVFRHLSIFHNPVIILCIHHIVKNAKMGPLESSQWCPKV